MTSVLAEQAARLLRPLHKTNRRDAAGTALSGISALAAGIIVLMVAIIMGNIIFFGWRTVTWEFLSAAPREGMTEGGIFPAIFGTTALVVLMVIALIPFGVGAAIYLHEYARPDSRFTRLVRFSVNNLAGVPSIVFGLFGLGFLSSSSAITWTGRWGSTWCGASPH